MPIVSLSRRGRCTLSSCTAACEAFIAPGKNSSNEAIPARTSDLCATCGHAWISHETTPASAARFNERGTVPAGGCHASGCGGFYFAVTPVASETICVCGEPASAHVDELLEQRPAPRNPTTPSKGQSQTTPTQTSPLGDFSKQAGIPDLLANPSLSFADWNPVEFMDRLEKKSESPQDSTNKRRQKSANKMNSGTNKRQKTLEGTKTSQGVIHEMIPRAANAANPSGSSGEAPEEVTTREVRILLIPTALFDTEQEDEDDRPTPGGLEVEPYDLDKIEKALANANLVLRIQLPKAGDSEVFDVINHALTAHCKRYHLRYSPVFDGEDKDRPFWKLAKISKSSNTGKITLKAHSGVGMALNMKDMLKHHMFCAGATGSRYVFMVPRLEHMWGPINALLRPGDSAEAVEMPHACLSRRVLNFFRREPEPVECRDKCPQRPEGGVTGDDEDSEGSELNSESNAPAEHAARSGKRNGGPPAPKQELDTAQEPVDRLNKRHETKTADSSTTKDAAGRSMRPMQHCRELEELLNAAELPGDHQGFKERLDLATLHYGLSVAREANWTQWTYERMTLWQASVIQPLTSDVPKGEDMVLKAPGVVEAAQAIIVCLVWYFSRSTSFSFCKKLIKAQCGRFSVKAGDGSGKGPTEEAFLCALEIAAANDEFFMRRVGYTVATLAPVDLASTPRRMRYMRMVGALVSIHLLLLHRAPQPLCPFVLLSILRGSSAFNDDPRLLKAASLDKIFSDYGFKDWRQLPSQSPDGPHNLGRATQMLFEGAFGYSAKGVLASFMATYDGASYRRRTHELTASLALSQHGAGRAVEYSALAEGMNWPFREDSAELFALEVLLAQENPVQKPQRESFRGLVAFIYNTSVKDVAQFLKHVVVPPLVFLAEPATLKLPEKTRRAWHQLILTRVREWVSEPGHPDQQDIVVALARCLAGVKPDEAPSEVDLQRAKQEIRKTGTDTCLRAGLLLLATTGSDRQPLEPEWEISVRASYAEDIIRLSDDELLARAKKSPVPARFGACLRTVDLVMDVPMVSLLSRKGPDFAVWFHLQVLLSLCINQRYTRD